MATGSNLFSSHEAKKLVNTYGGTTQPVYINSGVPTNTIYTLGSTVSAGTANRLTYYSGANTLSATGHYSSSDKIAINSTSTPSYNLYVNGSSQFNGHIMIGGSSLGLTHGGTWLGFYYTDLSEPESGLVNIKGSGRYGLAAHMSYTDGNAINALNYTGWYKNASNSYSVTPSALILGDTELYYYKATAKIYSKNEKISPNEYIVLHSGNYNNYAPTKTGTGASGTWGISISGNAATATKATQDGSGNTITSKYVTLDTTQTISEKKTFSADINAKNIYTYTTDTYSLGTYNNRWKAYLSPGTIGGRNYIKSTPGAGARTTVSGKTIVANPKANNSDTFFYVYAIRDIPAGEYVFSMDCSGFLNNETWSFGVNGQNSGYYIVAKNGRCSIRLVISSTITANTGIILDDSEGRPSTSTNVVFSNFMLEKATSPSDFSYAPEEIWKHGDSVTGAVWNDYAEYREVNTSDFGRCVYEIGDDTMELTTKRLQKGCSITSDTWGFAQGKTEKAKTPIAVSGRVLAYPYEDIGEFRNHIGDAVCSGPEGTVSIMTDEEVIKYPLAVIGIISAIPDYEEWGGGEGSDRDSVKVNGRVWIRIR